MQDEAGDLGDRQEQGSLSAQRKVKWTAAW